MTKYGTHFLQILLTIDILLDTICKCSSCLRKKAHKFMSNFPMFGVLDGRWVLGTLVCGNHNFFGTTVMKFTGPRNASNHLVVRGSTTISSLNMCDVIDDCMASRSRTMINL